MNYFISALTSDDQTVVSNAEAEISQMDIPREERKKFDKKLEVMNINRLKGSISYDNKADNGGKIVGNMPKGDTVLNRRFISTIDHMNKSLQPQFMDSFRQYAKSGSEIRDAMVFVANLAGFGTTAFDDNVQLSAFAKRIDASVFNEFGVPMMSTAVNGINAVADQPWGDRTQPFLFGAGIVGYTGAEEFLSKEEARLSTAMGADGKTKKLHEFMVPNPVDGKSPDIFNSSGRSAKERGTKYLRYIRQQQELGGDNFDFYEHNMFRLAKDMRQATEDDGYMQEGKFKMDVDRKINTRMYNFNTQKFERIEISYEQAALMLSAGLAAVIRGNALRGK